MSNSPVIYQQKLLDNLAESKKHLLRLENAIQALESRVHFPITQTDYTHILQSVELLAYSDQIIYRFSKLQDTIGAKLFKSVLLYEGENVNRPFLDILNRLEAMDIINIESWFEIRELRNEIAHDYDEHDETAIKLLNAILKRKKELKNTLKSIENLLNL
ncbi:hypothetical protein JX580_05095 [Thiomicrospira microaerophila]|uniref:hypothetical protein n=1 Tax=Thiomicrospira microaerophila TaxID=406020 RepID=UPI00200E5D7C|nr:hypothetical protein [Thiomicrospira microaerophila]UQB43253.1 hypothetical protein JX580_05095 [Thiomicrospira microaerophila]